jgi:hypothetical protein
MHLVLEESLTERLVAMQIIGQDRHLPWLKVLCITLYPSFDGLLFAVLLFVTVLWHHKLWIQAEHLLLSGRTQDS